MDDLTKEFIAESQEGLDRMERCLTELEMRPGDGEQLVGEIFRAVHTIKGTTGFLGFDRLEKLARNWQEIEPSEVVRETAMRVLRVHPLRAADALQLAAAFVASELRPASLDVVTLDERLAAAARKEGFGVVDLAAA